MLRPFLHRGSCKSQGLLWHGPLRHRRLHMSGPSTLKKAFLSPPAAGYAAVQRIRERAYASGFFESVGASLPVVSVGNLVMGGSGKTPFVIYLAELMSNSGIRPAIISRGYKGRSRATVLVVGEGRSRSPRVGPVESGDEPYLMAARLPNVPVLTGARRILPIEVSKRLFQCKVAILDDGFQHLQLRRDVDIVLLNGLEDAMFPLGSLREPLSALGRAHMVGLVGTEAPIPAAAESFVRGKPIFRCQVVPIAVLRGGRIEPLDQMIGKDVILVSGIAHPVRFQKTVEALGCTVVRHSIFRDHHVFSQRELREFLAEAGDTPVLFTEKDWVKLPDWFTESRRVAALRIGIAMQNEAEFREKLKQFISGAWPEISSKL